jgi:hypothetical protein
MNPIISYKTRTMVSKVQKFHKCSKEMQNQQLATQTTLSRDTRPHSTQPSHWGPFSLFSSSPAYAYLLLRLIASPLK